MAAGRRAFCWLARRWVEVLLSLGLAAQCAPLLVTRVLPLHDAPGMLGLVATFAHRGDPAARIDDFYQFDLGLYPSALTFAWGALAARVGVPIDLAFHVFIAVFCLLGPPLALLAVLKAFGRPPALVLLALPVVWHHQVWFGFLGSAAALTGILASLALAKRAAGHPTLGHHLGLAGALLFVALGHPFSLALALLVLAPFPLWPAPGDTRRARLFVRGGRLLCFLPTAGFVASWALRFFGSDGQRAESGSASAWSKLRRELRLERPPLGEDLRTFVEWLGGGYTSRADEAVVIVAVVSLLAFSIFGIRSSVARDRRGGGLWLTWAVGTLLAGYLFLPHTVYWPTYWWALRVRCAVPLFLIAVAAVRLSPRGLPAWVLAPVAATAIAFGAFVTHDFATYFRGQVLAGFDRALAAIPPGQSVLAMPAPEPTRYTRPHPYLVQYYVLRKGGRAVPYLRGHPGSYWVTMKPPPDAPPWGDPRQFRFEDHGLGYDYFLLERPPGTAAPNPFAQVPSRQVERVLVTERWWLYRRR